MHRGQFGRRLEGVDTDAVIAMGRAFVDERPRSFKELGDHLLTRWPDRDRMALEQSVRTGVPLVQVPPRGLWGRSGPIAHTSIEAWLGQPPREGATLDDLVRRYLGAFGPASVMDVQAWCGLTRLGEVIERLRPSLVAFRDEAGRELFDLPDAPRPDPDTPAPPRFLYDFENLLLSYADRSRTGDAAVARAIAPVTQEPISTFTIDGFVAGTWRIERAGKAGKRNVRDARHQARRPRGTGGGCRPGRGGCRPSRLRDRRCNRRRCPHPWRGRPLTIATDAQPTASCQMRRRSVTIRER